MDWEDGYFPADHRSSFAGPDDGYISTSPHVPSTAFDAFASETEHEHDSALESEHSPRVGMLNSLREEDEESDAPTTRPTRRPESNGKTRAYRAATPEPDAEKVAEVVIFDYGVAVFLGFDEHQERMILEDLQAVSVFLPLSLPIRLSQSCRLVYACGRMPKTIGKWNTVTMLCVGLLSAL